MESLLKKEAPREKEAKPAPEPEGRKVIQLAKKLPKAGASGSIPPSSPRIVTTASSKNVNADAEITGELSFGATRHFFGEYLLKMKQAVERQWVSRLVSQYTGVVSAEAVIDFKIQPDGRVTDLAIAEFDGDNYFPVLCVSSITDAQPFDEIPYDEIEGLPQEYKNKALSVRFTFRYH
jgi:outer membrane biosynthesis protein TonB